MKEKRVFAVFIIIYVVFVLFQQMYMFRTIGELSVQKQVTAKAVGVVQLCINQQPSLNYTCDTTIPHNIPFSCQVNATDPDPGTTFSFSSLFLTPTEFFDISSSGLIDFTPNASLVGGHDFRITVSDSTGCPNGEDQGDYSMQVYCANNPPVLNFTCNTTMVEDEEYYCKANATDIDIGNMLNFRVEFNLNETSNVTVFNMSGNGVIDFTPNQDHTGNHTFLLQVNDSDTCNNSDEAYINIEVIGANDAPVFSGPILDQSWEQDTTLGSFIDLDSYFSDPDYDPLTYDHTILNYIQIIININNEITLIPVPGWSGVEYIRFFAFDPSGLNATSNDIMLVVTQKAAAVDQPVTGGGGGGGGGYIGCIPEWYCKSWGDCQPDGTQVRLCSDLHECDNSMNQPNTTQPCNFEHTCYDGILGPDEEDIDCGGICPPCATCYDRVQNQGEKGIDCGGPCIPCESVEEAAIRNETKIMTETPDIIKKIPWLTTLLLYLVLLLSIVLLLWRFRSELKKALFSAHKKRKEARKALLEAKDRESILERVAKLERKISRTSKTNLIIEFSGIVRDYFKAILRIEHELTNEEIITLIRSRGLDNETKDMLIEFFRKSTELEYSGKSLFKTDLYTLLADFIEIIKLTSISSTPVEQQVVADKNAKEIIASAKKLEHMFMDISEAYLALKNDDLNNAYALYMKIHKNYGDLMVKHQKKVHSHVHKLHDEIKMEREKLIPKG